MPGDQDEWDVRGGESEVPEQRFRARIRFDVDPRHGGTVASQEIEDVSRRFIESGADHLRARAQSQE